MQHFSALGNIQIFLSWPKLSIAARHYLARDEKRKFEIHPPNVIVQARMV